MTKITRVQLFGYPKSTGKELYVNTYIYGTILSGHDALKKTYLCMTNAYFWSNMKKDIQAHIDSCLQCQVRKNLM